MAANDSPNEIVALVALVTLSRFAVNKVVRPEEIQRQLATASAMVASAADSAASSRFRAHEGALRMFLSGAVAKDALAEELGLTQDFLALGRP